MINSKNVFRVFSVISPSLPLPPSRPPPPPADYFPQVEAVAAATSVFTECVFCVSVLQIYILQISSTFQEAEGLLKLIKVNK